MLSPFIPIPMPMPVPPVAGDAEVASGAGADGRTDGSSDIRDVGTDGGPSYEWGGFDDDDPSAAVPGRTTPPMMDDSGGDLGGDFSETEGFEEFDDFGAPGEEVASGGLFDLLKDFMSDD